MLKLGHIDDLYPSYIQTYIRKTCGNAALLNIGNLLAFLDEHYGRTRDAYNSDGGYIVIIENKDEWITYDNEMNGMLKRNNYENFNYHENSNFVQVDYIVNNETVISVYMLKELFIE